MADDKTASRFITISVEDCAVAMIDEMEKPQDIHWRFTVRY